MAELLKGIVESDETYVGGKSRNRRGRPGPESNKMPVVALVERGGKVKAFPVERVTSATLKNALRKHVSPSAKLMTDELGSYRKLGKGFAGHETVTHAAGEYVPGEARTNTVEGFFSLLKRGINGTFHHVGKGHLHRYCEEFAFRYNNRIALGVNDSTRASLIVTGAEGKRLTYKMPAGPSEN